MQFIADLINKNRTQPTFVHLACCYTYRVLYRCPSVSLTAENVRLGNKYFLTSRPYQYQYQRSKYQYKYQYLACKYKYKYQYPKIVPVPVPSTTRLLSSLCCCLRKSNILGYGEYRFCEVAPLLDKIH